MPNGYILALVDVPDETAYRASGYMQMAEDSIRAHGGRFLVRGGDPAPLEGAPIGRRIVILEFPIREAAAAFHASEQYAPAITLRQSLSASQLVLLTGFDPG